MTGPARVGLLLVEDEPVVGRTIQAMLEHAGFDVLGRAISGQQAIELAAALRPDAVVMDIGLPDMDGLEAAERITQQSPVPVVVLSAYDTPALLDRAARAGVGAYLVKPADIREMERAIAVAIARFDDMVALRRLNGELAEEMRQRALAERELLASEERFRTAVDFSNDWEYWLAPDGHLVYVSPSCQRVTGYSRDDFQADPSLLVEIALPEDRAVAAQFCSAGDATWSCDTRFRIVTRDGQVRWVERVCQPVRGADGVPRGWRASIRDVTDRLRLEERLREARKAEALGQLAGGLAHDLNNLLTVITGYAELAREDAGANGALQADLQEIQMAGDRAGRIISHLLSYGRRQVLRLTSVDLNALLAGLHERLSEAAGPAVQVRLRLDYGVAGVRMDAQRLEQSLLEMASNAAEAMPGGGQLAFETRMAEPIAEVTGPVVLLRVADTGTGMTAEVRERVFDPFFTTRDHAERDGLGLAAAYGLVRQVGGTITVTSEPQAGTTFDIYLPVAEGLGGPPHDAEEGVLA